MHLNIFAMSLVHGTVCGESAARGSIEAQSSPGPSLTTFAERWNFVTYRQRSFIEDELFASENHFVCTRPLLPLKRTHEREHVGLFNVTATTRQTHCHFAGWIFIACIAMSVILVVREVNESNFHLLFLRDTSRFKEENTFCTTRVCSRLFFFFFFFSVTKHAEENRRKAKINTSIGNIIEQ